MAHATVVAEFAVPVWSVAGVSAELFWVLRVLAKSRSDRVFPELDIPIRGI